MNPRFFTVQLDAAGEVSLSGVIDENSQLLTLMERSHQGRLALSLAGITFINSQGVRDWIRLVASANRAGVRLEVTRVAEPLVHQFNMIVATRTGVEVRSFYAPFACDHCGHEESMCIEVEPARAALQRMQPPEIKCPGCSATMAFNDFPERYFSFLCG
jgi:eukaryotic-like serine/threonine-protein kinase